ncbi:hypothetical protein, conserved [Trypanosoma brucei gambiense DAL972]|uniref:Transmembrane protein n=2 Tax=Trypanosoma brucei TaxID=5691 RepID=D0A2J0_TRYB9|nr:hypothetical protein, conserved [Trypanosoma brucei gambiense DAL972]RHW69540.1 hypothetical protein DPX39_100052300 [Trypanosoma brucei equiperdum]CBH15484.1 hypothetical protein, conserved [Trypanosoma brucei gambiense DAL972]|eukprot:XP_011777748.1 hypothetical protein, conserved [Trypanosoma brucei gambiense DAL972]
MLHIPRTASLLLAVIIAVASLSVVTSVAVGVESVDVAVEALHEAIISRDVAAVKLLLEKGDLKSKLKGYTPSPFYWVADEKNDSKKLDEIMNVLLEELDGEIEHDYGRYHPLTRAVHNRLSHVVDTLIHWPTTINEVLATYLLCDDVGFVPEGVTIVVTAYSRDCFFKFPQRVAYEHSKIAAVIRRRHREKFHEASKKSSSVKFDWENPFLTPPAGVKPPQNQHVMNPRAFTDFSQAFMYYFFGEWVSPYRFLYHAMWVVFGLLVCRVIVTAVRERSALAPVEPPPLAESPQGDMAAAPNTEDT